MSLSPIDPLNPFAGTPGNPMDDVLALQSYPSGEGVSADGCLSWESKVVICPSGVSGINDEADSGI